jgi:hypothetical protein
VTTQQKGDLRVTFGDNGWDTRVEINGEVIQNVTEVRLRAAANDYTRVIVELVGWGRQIAPLTAKEWTERYHCVNCKAELDEAPL